MRKSEENHLLEIARGNIERHLGDCESQTDFYDNVFTLGFDALVNAGCSNDIARRIAENIAVAMASDCDMVDGEPG